MTTTQNTLTSQPPVIGTELGEPTEGPLSGGRFVILATGDGRRCIAARSGSCVDRNVLDPSVSVDLAWQACSAYLQLRAAMTGRMRALGT
jgi:hypothetical protein